MSNELKYYLFTTNITTKGLLTIILLSSTAWLLLGILHGDFTRLLGTSLTACAGFGL